MILFFAGLARPRPVRKIPGAPAAESDTVRNGRIRVSGEMGGGWIEERAGGGALSW